MKPELPERITVQLPGGMDDYVPHIGDDLLWFDRRVRVSRMGTVVAIDGFTVTLEFEA